MTQSNIIIKGLLISVAAVIVFVILKNVNDDSTQGPVLNGGQAISELERSAMGIEVDGPEDTVNTLVAEVRTLKSTIKSLKAETDDLLAMKHTMTSEMKQEMNEARQAIEAGRDADLKKQRSQMDALLNRMGNDKSPKPDGSLFGNEPNGQRVGDTFWVTPMEHDSRSASGLSSFTNQITSLGNNLAGSVRNTTTGVGGARSYGRQTRTIEEPIPHFTIAKNATLVNATMMTALIGRVPVGGNVTDPYLFKVIVGRDNLIANGHELPEVSYAIASGEAYGDWTLSCVRGSVYSITFVFEDGTIRTVPEPEDVYKNTQKTRNTEIGVIADEFGNPCVPGDKKSNAAKYLGGRVLANAAEAAAIAAAASETTQFTTTGNGGIGTGSVVTGDRTDYVYNATLAGAADETAQWIRERQAQEFDAVYVNAGGLVAVHVTEEIAVDYDPYGRKTHYQRASLRGTHRVLD